MALIKCVECGKEISDRAESCPNCGCPVSADISEKVSRKCLYCGESLNENELYCDACGMRAELFEEENKDIQIGEANKNPDEYYIPDREVDGEDVVQSGTGIAALVFGIIGLLLSCIVIGIIPCIIGAVLAAVTLSKKNVKHGTAIGGLVCSVIGIGIFLLFMFFVNAFSNDKSSNNETTIDSVNSFNQSDNIVSEESRVNDTEFTYENLTVKYLRHEIATNKAGEKVVVIYYDFTNNSDKNTSFDISFSDKVFQNGIILVW